MSRTRSSFQLLLAASLAAAIPFGVAVADTVTKKDGSKIEGKIVEETDTTVTVQTPLGELKVPRSDIRSIETGKTALEQFKDKWEEVDRTDSLALLELADWCEENKLSREAKKVYREIVDKVDPENERARRGLGFVKVDGEWKTKAEVDAEKKAAEDKAKKDKAAEKAKTDKPKAGKSKKPTGGKSSGDASLGADMDFPPEVDEYVAAGKDREEEDAKVKADLEDFFGQKFTSASSLHFQLSAQMPPDEAKYHIRIAEKCLIDANTLFDLPAENRAWNGAFMIFHVQQKGTFTDLIDWLDKNVAEIKPETKKFFKDGGGLMTDTQKGPLACHYESGVPLKNAIPQWIGNKYITGRTRGGAREWLQQGFGMYLAIHEFGVSLMTFVTQSKYENAVEVADKNSDSAYKLLCWEIIEGRTEDGGGTRPWNELRLKNLNSLDYADLAKCWSVVDFLMKEHREDFKKYLAMVVTVEDEEQALRSTFNWSGPDLDKAWEAYVRANYDKAPPTLPKKKPQK